MGFLDLFTGDADKRAAEANRQVLAGYGSDAQRALSTGYATGTENIGKAIGAYDPLTTLAGKYGKAGDLYLDALGVNGPEGVARATGSFQTTPGYELTKTADLEALARRRATTGMYASGNADQDTMDYITKALYGTQYQPWLQGLQTAGQQGGQYATTAAGGQAAGYGALSDLASKYASDQAGVFGNVAQGNIAANNQIAAGQMAGAKNLLGAGLSLASLAIPGGGSLGGALMAGAGSGIGSLLAPSGGFTGFTSFGR